MTTYKNKMGQKSEQCEVSNQTDYKATCALPGEGTYLVQFFIGPERYGKYSFAGQLEVNSSPWRH